MWDHFKGLGEAEPRRAAHLAHLTAALIAGGAVPLSVLKARRACQWVTCCLLNHAAPHLAMLSKFGNGCVVLNSNTVATFAPQVVHFETAMSAREQLFWNLCFEHLLLSCPDDAAVTAVFERLASNVSAKTLQTALVLFLKRTFQSWVKSRLQTKNPKRLALVQGRLDLALQKSKPQLL